MHFPRNRACAGGNPLHMGTRRAGAIEADRNLHSGAAAPFTCGLPYGNPYGWPHHQFRSTFCLSPHLRYWKISAHRSQKTLSYEVLHARCFSLQRLHFHRRAVDGNKLLLLCKWNCTLEIAYVAPLKMQELLVYKVQFQKSSQNI